MIYVKKRKAPNLENVGAFCSSRKRTRCGIKRAPSDQSDWRRVRAADMNAPRNSAVSLPVAVSLPRLVDLEWRVDVKTASDSVSRMAVPTCILHMKVWLRVFSLSRGGKTKPWSVFRVQIQDDGSVKSDSSSTSESSVTVELSKETLDTMLDGLGRIREQLSAVAGK